MVKVGSKEVFYKVDFIYVYEIVKVVVVVGVN